MKKIIFILLFSTLINSSAKVEIFEISSKNTDLLPGGKEADGIIGDFVIKNQFIECVIAGPAPNRKANMGAFWGVNGVTPGCLYDLCIKGSNNDQLTIFSPSKQQGRVSYVKPAEDGKSIITYISPAVSGGLTKKHTYILNEGEYGLTITSELYNASEQKISGPINDNWTKFRESGKFENIEWADSVDPSDKCGYAYVWLPDENGKTPPKSKTFHPGTKVFIERYLCVGNSPAQAFGRVMKKIGKVGKLFLELEDSRKKPLTTARVELIKGDHLIPAYPDGDGVISLHLPVGDWKLIAKDNGRKRLETKIVVAENTTLEKKLSFELQSGINFIVTKSDGTPSPCKAQFIGIEGTPSPNLGPVDRAHGCKDQYHSENGRFFVGLLPGKYKIILTRGIEHDHYEEIVEVKEGKVSEIISTLKHSVSTPGWVSTDFHNHSTPSGDNVCGTADRLINLAAEHIEFAPTTEHNRIMDWAPIINSLGLKNEISTIPGMELTGSGAHLNAFPLTPKPHHQDGGAPTWTKDPRVNALNLMNHPGHHRSGWVHINHPDMIENFIDRNKDGHADDGYEGILSLIDAIETENYRAAQILHPAPYKITRLAGREKVSIVREFVWLQMLNSGLKTWGIAVSDAHTVHGNGVGGWRTYIPSSTDSPSEIDWQEISRHAKAGQMILTTGPFLDVKTSDGTIAGGVTRATRSVTLNIRVQCPSWIDIDRIQVLVNGRANKALNFTRESHSNWFKNGVVKFDKEVEIKLSEDSHLIVVAYGSNFDLKTGYGSSGQSSIRPCAYNNPIFVDLDGNGFAPNGDTLDYPLPTGNISVKSAKELISNSKAKGI